MAYERYSNAGGNLQIVEQQPSIYSVEEQSNDASATFYGRSFIESPLKKSAHTTQINFSTRIKEKGSQPSRVSKRKTQRLDGHLMFSQQGVKTADGTGKILYEYPGNEDEGENLATLVANVKSLESLHGQSNSFSTSLRGQQTRGSTRNNFNSQHSLRYSQQPYDTTRYYQKAQAGLLKSTEALSHWDRLSHQNNQYGSGVQSAVASGHNLPQVDSSSSAAPQQKPWTNSLTRNALKTKQGSFQFESDMRQMRTLQERGNLRTAAATNTLRLKNTAMQDHVTSQSTLNSKKKITTDTYGNEITSATAGVKFQTEDSVSDDYKEGAQRTALTQHVQASSTISHISTTNQSGLKKRFDFSQTSGTLRSIQDSLIANNRSLSVERSTTLIDEKSMQERIEMEPKKPINVQSRVIEMIQKLNRKASRRIVKMQESSAEKQNAYPCIFMRRKNLPESKSIRFQIGRQTQDPAGGLSEGVWDTFSQAKSSTAEKDRKSFNHLTAGMHNRCHLRQQERDIKIRSGQGELNYFSAFVGSPRNAILTPKEVAGDELPNQPRNTGAQRPDVDFRQMRNSGNKVLNLDALSRETF